MGQLILNITKDKVEIPDALRNIKDKGFLSTQYSLNEIKDMLSNNILSEEEYLNYEKIIEKT